MLVLAKINILQYNKLLTITSPKVKIMKTFSYVKPGKYTQALQHLEE
jgi:hypothetical protein